MTVVVPDTALDCIVNVALVCPAGIVNVEATVPLGELEVSVTTAPPLGAGPFRVAVIVAEDPPTIEVGPVRLIRFAVATSSP